MPQQTNCWPLTLLVLALAVSSSSVRAQVPVISKVSELQGPPGSVTVMEGSLDNIVSVQIGGVDAFFSIGWSDNNGAIVGIYAEIPYEAVSGPITVRSPEGSATTAAVFQVVARPPPVIGSFAPASSAPGEQIILYGTNLIDVLSVEFNGVQARERHDGMLGLWFYVTVPPNATSGPITLKTRTGSFTTSQDFNITPPPYRPPVIHSFAPESGPPGTSVSLIGSNLVEVVSVQFNGIESPWFGAGLAGSLYSATVPTNATAGPITIQTRSDSYTTATPFTVTGFPPPQLTSFSPTSAAPGARVTIQGHSLLRATAVLFNGVPAAFARDPNPPIDPRDVWPLIAVVPINAGSGPITVIAPEGSSISTEPFAVLPPPVLIGFDIEAAAPGALVEILGKNLDQVTSVTVGQTPAAFTQKAARLQFTVPPGTGTASVTVTAAGGVVTSSQPFVVLSVGDPLEHWTWQGKLGNQFQGISFGSGLFVAVGWSGAIFTSRDGAQWIPRSAPATDSWMAVAYGAGTFVIGGQSGQILSSTDGIVWTKRTSGLEGSWTGFGPGVIKKLAYGQGKFVAVGGNGVSGTILTSPDGATWTKASSEVTQNLLALAYGNGVFVAGGKSSTLLVSKDGLAWNRAELDRPYAFLSDLTFGDGVFVGVGNGFVITSTDGQRWVRRDLADFCFVFLRTVAYGAGQFVAVSENQGRTVTSTDGIHWSCGQIPTRETINGLAYGVGRFVAVGAYGALLSSPDGGAWRREPAGNGTSLVDVASGIDGFVAVGSVHGVRAPRGGRSILTSQTGDTWDEAGPLPLPFDEQPVIGVTFDGSSFVAIGGSAGSSVLLSSDRHHWTARPATPGNYGIAYGNGSYVSVGGADPVGAEATLARSLDGWTWTRQQVPTTQRLASVAYGNGRWVAVGTSGTILNSTDGVDWSLAPARTEHSLNRVIYSGGKFIAVGFGGTVLISPNGVDWTISQNGDSRTLFGIAFGDEHFVAVGEQGAIVTSTDAVTCKSRNSGTQLDLFGVAFANHTFVVVGDQGALLKSKALSLPLRFSSVHLSTASVQLRMINERAQSFRVQRSTSLVDWADLPIVTHPSQGLLLIETDPPLLPQCFYRALVP